MAVKSVIDIDLNDAAFRRFQGIWDKFQGQLAKAPDTWALINKRIDGTKKSFDGMVADIVAAEARQRLMLSAQREADRLLGKTASNWSYVARYTRTVAGDVASISRGMLSIVRSGASILKWGTIGGVGAGLLGAGGLFGFDRLAAGVGAGRRSSQGLGLPYGAQRAFELNYGKAVDAGPFLANVRDALTDVTKRYALTLMGVRNVEGKNTGQVAEELIPLIKDLADRTPKGQEAQAIQAHGLDVLGITTDDFMRLRTMRRSEIEDMRRRSSQDKRDLAVAEQTQLAMQDFVIQMNRAGQKVETVLVNGLSPLAPSLTRLSDAFAEAVKAFLAGPMKEWLPKLAAELERFATYIGKPEFQHDVESFVTNVGAMARAAGDFIAWAGAWVRPRQGGGEGWSSLAPTAKSTAFAALAGGALGLMLRRPKAGAAIGGLLGLSMGEAGAAELEGVGGGKGGGLAGLGAGALAMKAAEWGIWGASFAIPKLAPLTPGLNVASMAQAGLGAVGDEYAKHPGMWPGEIAREQRGGRSVRKSIFNQFLDERARQASLGHAPAAFGGSPVLKIARAGDVTIENADKAEGVAEILRRWGVQGPAPPPSGFDAGSGLPAGPPSGFKPDNFIDKFGTPIGEQSSSMRGVDRIVAAIQAGAARRNSVTIMNATGGDAVVVANQAATA